MRARLPLFCSLVAVSVIGVAAPASAAGTTYNWTAGGGGNQETATAANWDLGVPGSDENLVFGAGTHAHNNLATDLLVRGLSFTASGFLLDGNRIALGTGGASATVDASTNLDMNLSVDQTWSAAAGATFTHHGTINVLTGVLTVSGAGTIDFANRIDGNGGAGQVVKTGTGTLILSGGGGAINTAGAGDRGLDVQAGETRVTGMLAGTDFVINGGTLTGGNLSDPLLGVVRALTLNTGSISPGVVTGEISTIHTWEPFTANAGGILAFDVDGTTSDRLDVYKDVTLNAPTLHLNVVTAPVVGTVLTLAATQIGTVTGTVTSRTGEALTSGSEFIDSGHRWLLSIGQGSMWVEYLGAAPVPPGPSLAETGVTTGWLLPVGGGILVLGIILLILFRKRSAKFEG
ncbi:LPXTG-motif cell wall-anchored protein [Cryobacterium mesophilum]|uniref:LPXTG cell wall anchor domain-containing protein n=1 Tax=Terrimesophilobacter mesophilus TaxID=433647 RepID=A0A4R8V8M6_9MICO|nr:LPXTG cell wall anchor domain-containing protein [Terrimesophilobacter mesophilus]MBB5632191.1 LPXTG-motif cell wall-anchored protein [Terrimesophilobacter mesophilus]TFB79053.1 LPXTG cell wall anchor domain-containing protein [Terrimesophilobacter mesophilus]